MKKIFFMFIVLLIFIPIISVTIFIPLRDSRGEDRLTDTQKTEITTLPSPITIIIDAGHGGEDGGAVGKNGVLEKDINLSIAFMVEDILKDNGYLTIMTRSDDRLLYDKNTDYEGRKKQLDLAARVEIAEKTDDAIFVSIHMNSFSQTRYKGLQVYYSKNSPESKTLAEEIQQNARLLLDTSNNRVAKVAGSNIFLLDRITRPAVLIECGFLSNTEECAKLSTEEYQREVSEVICLSIISYLEGISQNDQENTDISHIAP